MANTTEHSIPITNVRIRVCQKLKISGKLANTNRSKSWRFAFARRA